MFNEKLWKALDVQFDAQELKALEKEDKFDLKGPRVVAKASPRTLSRLQKFLKEAEEQPMLA